MRGTVSMILDLRGLSVPVVVARTAVAMTGLRSDELIEVLTTDPGAIQELLVWSRATGNRLVEQTAGDGWYRFIVRRR